jgi:hypothetical protein
MTAITAVYPKVRVEAPGVPEPLLAEMVGDSLREFFRDTEAWRHTVSSLLDWTTAATFPTLTQGVELPANTRVLRVDEVKYAGDSTNLKVVPYSTRQQLDGEFPDWEVRTGTSPQRWTNDGNAGTPRIIPIADANVTCSLQVRVSVVPTSSMTDVPDWWYDEFHDIWAYGALARLLRMPGRDWTNQALGAYYEQKELGGISMAKSRAKAEYGQPNRTMSYGGIGGSTYVGYDDYGQ